MRNRSLAIALSVLSVGLFGFYDSAPVSYEVKQTESSLDPKVNIKLSCSGNFDLHLLIQNFKSTPITVSLDQVRVEDPAKPLKLYYSSLKSNLSLRPSNSFAKDSVLIPSSVSLNMGEAYEARFSETISGKSFTVSIAVQDGEKIGVRKFTCAAKL